MQERYWFDEVVAKAIWLLAVLPIGLQLPNYGAAVGTAILLFLLCLPLVGVYQSRPRGFTWSILFFGLTGGLLGFVEFLHLHWQMFTRVEIVFPLAISAFVVSYSLLRLMNIVGPDTP